MTSGFFVGHLAFTSNAMRGWFRRVHAHAHLKRCALKLHRNSAHTHAHALERTHFAQQLQEKCFVNVFPCEGETNEQLPVFE